MKTKLFVAALVALSCLPVSGKDVYFFSGNDSEASRTISNVTSIVIGDGKLTLKTSSGEAETDVDFSEFTAFSFQEHRTSGVSIAKSPLDTSVSFHNGIVSISCAVCISSVEVYAANGTKVASHAPNASNITFPILDSGLYILKVSTDSGEKAFKVMR